jgi:hypothetical protein
MDLAGEVYGLEVYDRGGRLDVACPCSPLALIFEQTAGGDVFVALRSRAQSEFRGDRTDLHDAYSWLAAAFLRRSGVASSSLIDIEHPASGIAGELNCRYLVPAQSMGPLLSPDEVGLRIAQEMLTSLGRLEERAHFTVPFWHPDVENDRYFDSLDPEVKEWSRGVAQLLGSRSSADDISTFRSGVGWYYYRTADGAIAVIESEDFVDLLETFKINPDEEIAGINGFLYTGNGINNFVSHEALALAAQVLDEAHLSTTSTPAASASVIPLEDGVIIAGSYRAVLIRLDTGSTGFARERSLVLERNRIEQERLFPPSGFTWATTIDGGRFERLIYDLLECEPGVLEVRGVGAAREGDDGRDLIVRWITPPLPGEVTIQGSSPMRERTIIVQCKARARSVGKADLGGGVLDTIYKYEADGYFLAVSSQPAVSTLDLLDVIKRRGDYFTNWWSRAELELRLRRNPQVLKRYDDVVQALP